MQVKKSLNLVLQSQRNTLLAIQSRGFGQTEGQRERKYRGGLSYEHKNFLKTSNFKDHMKARIEHFKSRIPLIPLSKITKADPKSVSRKRRPFISMSPMTNPKLLKALNQQVYRDAQKGPEDIWEKEGGSLRNKFFVLDHTAEVLENYRKIQENKLFTQILHDEREKKAFLKKESRKLENLIENYEQKYQNYKYFQGTNEAVQITDIDMTKDMFLEQEQLEHQIGPSTNKVQIEPKIQQRGYQQINHKDYAQKQKELQNMRIQKFLTPRSNNPELQKYLEEKSQYESASMSETSADELALKSQSGDDSERERVDIYRQSQLVQDYEKQKQLATDVEHYEKKIIEDYHKLDIYRNKNKSRVQISFNDLTLHENLNYIKYNLENTEEAFKMYDIVKEKFANNPEIPASIIQKLANRSTLKVTEIKTQLMQKYQYKNMLKQVSMNVSLLDNKQAIDTIYSISKLHKQMTIQEIQKEEPKFYQFFNNVIKSFLNDAKERITSLQSIEVAYLCKGLTNLRKLQSGPNQELEKQLRDLIKAHCLINVHTYNPYSTSKALRYLFFYNDSSESALQVYQILGANLLQTLAKRQEQIRDYQLTDVLIDIDPKDIVDIVRVYSTILAQQRETQPLLLPKLFEEDVEPKERQEESNELVNLSKLNPSQLENIQEISKALLNSLAEVIKEKESSLVFSNISDLMFHYASSGLLQNKKIFYYLEKVAEDQLILKERFNTINSTKLLWGFGKFFNRNLAPEFNLDIASSILNRWEFSRIPSVNHRLHRKVVDDVIGLKKMTTPQNFAITLYSCAALGFFDKEFFDNAFKAFEKEQMPPPITSLGYIVQALSILRINDYNNFLIEWLDQIIKDHYQQFFDKSGLNLNGEFSFVQILQGLTQIGRGELLQHEGIMKFTDYYIREIQIEQTTQHTKLLPSLLWSILALNKTEAHHEYVIKSHKSLLDNEFKGIQFSDCVLLNQIYNSGQQLPRNMLTRDQDMLLMQLGIRYDQLELKASIDYYKKYYGADIVNELVQGIKFLSFDQQFEIETYNPIRQGYIQLLDLEYTNGNKKATIMLDNKFDYLTDRQTINAFEQIRREQVSKILEDEGYKMINVNYKDLAAIHKSTISKDEYRAHILKEIINQ